MTTKEKTALILGVTGQDGALLAHHLVAEGWTVYGGFRRGFVGKFWRLDELGIHDQINLVNLNLLEPHQIMSAVADIKPVHIYHMAGDSFVVDSFEQPRTVLESNCIGTLNVLEAVRMCSPDSKLFFPSSSEIFGNAKQGEMLDENSPCAPLNPYGISRLAAQKLVDMYRSHHGLFACCGIMFNHEGPYRARSFVTRKVTYNLARLKLEGGDPMALGNLDASRDWGAASDYIGAMHKVLSLETPDNFVFATGKATSLKSFMEVAAECAGFRPVFEGEGVDAKCIDRKSGQVLAETAPKYFRKSATPPLIGNPEHLMRSTDFEGSRAVDQMAAEMVQMDMDRRSSGNVNVLSFFPSGF